MGAAGGDRSAETTLALKILRTAANVVCVLLTGLLGVAVRGVRRHRRSLPPLFGSGAGYEVEGSAQRRAPAATVATSELEV